MKYMLLAGEASGDLHASSLIEGIRKHDPDADFRFFGGDLMAKAARCRPDLHYDQMNVMGFSEVIRKFPQILRNLKEAKKLLLSYRPDILILVDYPGFNLKMARFAKNHGFRTAYFISPKVWAWKEYRVRQIRRYIDDLYSILPFEVGFYKKHDYKAVYVGNPSVAEMEYALGHLPPKRHFIERQGLDHDGRPVIAILPGSRQSEIRNNLPLMIAAAKRFPEFQFVVGAAPSVPEKFYREVAQDPGLPVVFGCTPTLLKYSQAALVTSGTATLETALIGTPQVVCYRANGSSLSYRIMEKLLKVKYVSLPNLIVENSVVPEPLLHRCTVESIARELSPLLQNSPRREWQLTGYKTMRRKLGTSSAADYAAELIVDSLQPEPHPEPDPKPDESLHRRRSSRRRPRSEKPTGGEKPEKEGKTEKGEKVNRGEKPKKSPRQPRKPRENQSEAKKQLREEETASDCHLQRPHSERLLEKPRRSGQDQPKESKPAQPARQKNVRQKTAQSDSPRLEPAKSEAQSDPLKKKVRTHHRRRAPRSSSQPETTKADTEPGQP